MGFCRFNFPSGRTASEDRPPTAGLTRAGRVTRPRRAAGPGPARVLVHQSETWSIKVKLCRCHKGSETIIQCSKTGFYGIPLRWDTDSFRHFVPPPSEREALARAPLTALPEKQGKPRLPRANRRARGKRKGPAGLAKPFLHCCKDHSALGAPTGHTPAHAPHSMQVSASMTYLPSPSEIALTGHSAAQAPQAMHSSEILYAMVKYTSLLVCLYCNSFGGKKQGLFLKKTKSGGFSAGAALTALKKSFFESFFWCCARFVSGGAAVDSFGSTGGRRLGKGSALSTFATNYL